MRLSWLSFAVVLVAVPVEAADPIELPDSATVFATVRQSEWCPTGVVWVDVRTGRYTYTPPAERGDCFMETLERPIREGTLKDEELAKVREAYGQVLRDGLDVPEFRENGRRACGLVVSNGGPQVLVVTAGRYTLVAKEQLGCWNEAATSLHRVLSDVFDPGDRRVL